MADAVLIWWGTLSAVAVVNTAAWAASMVQLSRLRPHMSREVFLARRQLLWLSAAYVLGCAFRSLLPMVDAPRICLLDTWVSRIVIGRSVATVAELCFIAQWALLMREAARDTGIGYADLVARLVIPIIVAAEISSWYAVLTTDHFFHAVENALWTVTAALLVTAFIAVWHRVRGRAGHFLGVAITSGTAYIAFMVVVDVPMYIARWNADLAAGRDYLSWTAGLAEVMQRCVETRDLHFWLDDMPWMTLYFTIGVWFSIALVHAPPLRASLSRKTDHRKTGVG